jgi:hypothetical protein
MIPLSDNDIEGIPHPLIPVNNTAQTSSPVPAPIAAANPTT